MKRVALGFAVLFALVSFSLPCAAQYWPNMKDFKIPSNDDVMDARVKEALKQSKHRAEVEALRKVAYGQVSIKSADMDVKIIASLTNTLTNVNTYLSKLQKTVKKVTSEKIYYGSGYAMIPVYEDINTFSAVSKDLDKYLFTVQQCSGALKAQHINAKVAENCKKVISDKTFAYAKIMEISFPCDDRDNFFHAKKGLSSYFKTIVQPATNNFVWKTAIR